jgi:hypothetical protein
MPVGGDDSMFGPQVGGDCAKKGCNSCVFESKALKILVAVRKRNILA